MMVKEFSMLTVVYKMQHGFNVPFLNHKQPSKKTMCCSPALNSVHLVKSEKSWIFVHPAVMCLGSCAGPTSSYKSFSLHEVNRRCT